MNKKLFIIGLDGATFDLIKPLIKENKLPNFKKLMENGVYGELKSTIPSVTPLVWPAFYTGKNPGKLGLFDFINIRVGSYETSIANRKKIKAQPIWKILNSYDKKVGIINVPMTYPPDEVDGFMISGMETPSEKSEYTYPKGLKNEINKVCGKYEIEPGDDIVTEKENLIESMKRINEKLFKATLYLKEKKRWDLFIIVFRVIDIIQHAFWNYMEGDNKYKNIIFQWYQELDKEIGIVIEELDKNSNIILLSDHGFGTIIDYDAKIFHCNDWLISKGLLSINENVKGYLIKTLSKFGLDKEKIYNSLIKIFGLKQLKKIIIDEKPNQLMNQINWSKTTAFLSDVSISGHCGIRINLKSREPNGTVKKEDYDKIREKIIRELKNLTDLKKNRIIKNIWKREEIYSGPYLDNLPDIVFEPTSKFMVKKNITFKIFSDISKERISGNHKINGIFIAYGPHIKTAGAELKNLQIIDIAPTILHMFDIPIPEGIDGNVLDIFRKTHTIRYKKVSEREKIMEKIMEMKFK